MKELFFENEPRPKIQMNHWSRNFIKFMLFVHRQMNENCMEFPQIKVELGHEVHTFISYGFIVYIYFNNIFIWISLSLSNKNNNNNSNFNEWFQLDLEKKQSRRQKWIMKTETLDSKFIHLEKWAKNQWSIWNFLFDRERKSSCWFAKQFIMQSTWKTFWFCSKEKEACLLASVCIG